MPDLNALQRELDGICDGYSGTVTYALTDVTKPVEGPFIGARPKKKPVSAVRLTPRPAVL